MPQVPHVALHLPPPVKPRAGRRVASRPPADAGRRNMTHIICRGGGGAGREGWVRGAGVRGREEGASRAGHFCPGQLKSLWPPPTLTHMTPTLTRSPQPSLR